ncbi:hypothetical protein M3553_22785, partial [Bacillus subtilis]|nr:hypothetical protein [Bacillus subtilis]
VLAWPMFSWINHAPGFASLIVFQAVFGVLIAAYTGPILAAFAELFPTKVLSTGLSVAYNFAVTIFGGTAQLIATWLVKTTGSKLAPAGYVAACVVLSLVAISFGFERERIGLRDDLQRLEHPLDGRENLRRRLAVRVEVRQQP